jgi:putative transposase
MVATKECKHLAAQLFAETIARHGIEPGLQVHSDRGAAMKSDTLAQLLDSLGASRSFSRPRVSNDNPQAESCFKTMKYQPDYPGRFATQELARGWLGDFFAWHNADHHHAGLALFTPADVFHRRVAEVAAVRQAALDRKYAAHPERFPNGSPTVNLPPTVVTINPISTEVVAVGVPVPAVEDASADAKAPADASRPPRALHGPVPMPVRIPPSAPALAVAT